MRKFIKNVGNLFKSSYEIKAQERKENILKMLNNIVDDKSGKKGPLFEQFKKAVNNAKQYSGEDIENLNPSVVRKVSANIAPVADQIEQRQVITFSTDDSYKAARKIIDPKSGGGIKVGVLNFAGRRTPGGGFKGGYNAQEENLCDTSTLFLSLLYIAVHGDQNIEEITDESLIEKVKKLKEEVNKNWDKISYKTPIAEKGLIYTPYISITKENSRDEKGKKIIDLNKENQNSVNVISMAAYDLRWGSLNTEQKKRFGITREAGKIKISKQGKENYKEDTQKKIENMLRVFKSKGCTEIVLGPIGCGEFSPREIRNEVTGCVAQAYKDALNKEEFKDAFDNVVFSLVNKGMRKIFESEIKGHQKLEKKNSQPPSVDERSLSLDEGRLSELKDALSFLSFLELYKEKFDRYEKREELKDVREILLREGKGIKKLLEKGKELKKWLTNEIGESGYRAIKKKILSNTANSKVILDGEFKGVGKLFSNEEGKSKNVFEQIYSCIPDDFRSDKTSSNQRKKNLQKLKSQIDSLFKSVNHKAMDLKSSTGIENAIKINYNASDKLKNFSAENTYIKEISDKMDIEISVEGIQEGDQDSKVSGKKASETAQVNPQKISSVNPSDVSGKNVSKPKENDGPSKDSTATPTTRVTESSQTLFRTEKNQDLCRSINLDTKELHDLLYFFTVLKLEKDKFYSVIQKKSRFEINQNNVSGGGTVKSVFEMRNEFLNCLMVERFGKENYDNFYTMLRVFSSCSFDQLGPFVKVYSEDDKFIKLLDTMYHSIPDEFSSKKIGSEQVANNYEQLRKEFSEFWEKKEVVVGYKQVTLRDKSTFDAPFCKKIEDKMKKVIKLNRNLLETGSDEHIVFSGYKQ